jgi:two-component system OmpR family sensor kinase
MTLVAAMDMDAFAMAVRNLLDNAVNHGAVDGMIEVIVEPPGVIRIRNDGPLVASDLLAGLKHRFVRGESRSTGSGLGLAIVETVMTHGGGRLELFSPAIGRDDGFEARLTVCPDRSQPV